MSSIVLLVLIAVCVLALIEKAVKKPNTRPTTTPDGFPIVKYSGHGTRAGLIVFDLIVGGIGVLAYTNGDMGWAIGCLIAVLVLSFMELSFPYVGKTHPPRNAEEAYQDQRKFERRNDTGWFLIIVIVIFVLIITGWGSTIVSALGIN